MKNDADKKALFREIRIAVLAAMETGNHDRARTVLREYAVLEPELTAGLRADVLEAYNIKI